MTHEDNAPAKQSINLDGEASAGDKLIRLITEAALLDELYKRHKGFKEELAGGFEPGDKRTIKNAQGLELGSASKTAPAPKAVPDDMGGVLAQADTEGRELIDTLPEPGTPEYDEALDLVFTHAPHLLRTSIAKDDADAMAKDVLEHWQITGEIKPGWKITEGSKATFRLNKGRSKAAKAAVAHLVKQFDGLLELPNGEHEK